MTAKQPETTLDTRFSSKGATPTDWSEARKRLEAAALFWVATVRPDGRPHTTPLIAVWLDEALYFATGASERKARNLARNPHCILLTGCNTLDDGLDLVVEGDARRVTDDGRLRRVAEAYVAKYGDDWRFTVRDGVFHHQGVHEGAEALVFELAPRTAFGFGKGAVYSQTRWRM
jgi:hypothetical protein